MRVTLSLIAFIFLGVAAAGAIPEIVVRDDMVAGGNDGTLGLTSMFPNLPNQTESPLIPVDDADHRKPTGKHSRFAAYPWRQLG
jgi:hypothetical protein